ncbi:MAG: uracil-DNA glycosylase family protein, partial [Bacteroidota bacterium]
MTFAQQVIDYHLQLSPNWELPQGFDLIYPFQSEETIAVFKTFFTKYFSDNQPRRVLFGINPGRFGAGVTGVPFTDPKILEDQCAIPNNFSKRHEMSSIFIYDMIQAFGGPAEFYSHFYITSVCPLGFIKDGKNINYYDDRSLEKSVEAHIIKHLNTHPHMGVSTDVAYSIGQGKNYKYLSQLNKKLGLFEEIVALPHPRWVMQYRRKTAGVYID